jgi:DNA-binding beta-propeller fold protein YncE
MAWCLSWCPAARGQDQARAEKNVQLQKLLQETPQLPLERIAITIQPPAGENWALGRITSLALSHDRSMAYVMMRDDAAHPVIVVDRTGRVIRSWGNGIFQVPHNIAVDPDGNVWTTDAGSSRRIQKFTPDGEKLQEFSIDGGPEDCAYPGTPGNGGKRT